jgi:hypothetical protein
MLSRPGATPPGARRQPGPRKHGILSAVGNGMTREEAIAAARDFVARLGRAVHLEPEAVRHMEAERFNRLFGRAVYPSDFWVVEFPKLLPPGITECPGTVTVEVVEATGRVREVYVGMPVE